MNFVYIRQIIEDNNTTDREIKQAAEGLRVEILNGGFSDDISYEARCWVNGICQELNNAEQRAAAGFEPIHQQVMIGRWTNLLKFLLDGLQGVSFGFYPGDAALKYYEYHRSPSTAAIELPQELETARQYFTRAIEAGYIETTATGASWKGTKAKLGYFCMKAFQPPRPINAIEQLFGIKRLSGAITQASYDVKRADVLKWRGEIDNAIFNDEQHLAAAVDE
ncbi:MAG: hypothetical protein IJV11_01585 [Muribaculaceae bacterium]|nr:hypothetical protein [Muribaculaceae bacterium]